MFSTISELITSLLCPTVDPAWLLKTVLLTVVITILGGSFLLQQIRTRRRYAHLPTLPTTAILGNLLGKFWDLSLYHVISALSLFKGHMEHFWITSGTHLHFTVCK